MSLEDEFADIIKKSRLGQSYSIKDFLTRSGLGEEDLRALESGARSPRIDEVQMLAEALHLRPDPLRAIALGAWNPEPLPDWVLCENPVMMIPGDIEGYAVMGYVLFDDVSREAILFDTGYNPTGVLEAIEEKGLALKGICLTHGHLDHAGGLEKIHQRWPVPVYLGGDDHGMLSWSPPGNQLIPLTNGSEIGVGRFTVECLETPGHTPGGYCYRVSGASWNCCFVGDTLFAGSIGRSNPPGLYAEHLLSVRRKVLGLAPETILLPGHGPGTTVREERQWNPFG